MGRHGLNLHKIRSADVDESLVTNKGKLFYLCYVDHTVMDPNTCLQKFKSAKLAGCHQLRIP
jgi:hypothetical protein